MFGAIVVDTAADTGSGIGDKERETYQEAIAVEVGNGLVVANGLVMVLDSVYRLNMFVVSEHGRGWRRRGHGCRAKENVG